MKKIISLALVLAMALCIFAGCQPAPTNPQGSTPQGSQPAGNEKPLAGTYDVKIWVAENIVDLTKTQIDAFMQANPGIVINASIEGVPEGDAGSKVVADVASAPDIYCFAQDQLARLVQAAALAAPAGDVATMITEQNDAGSVAAARPPAPIRRLRRPDRPTKIDNPAQLGADLVAGAVGAISEYTLPCVVIDMGTASTISVIDKNGAYLGGVISAGVRLTLKALTENTAQLPAIDITAPKSVIGSNTVDCMKSGLIYGTASMLDGILDRIEDELGETPTVVATGGLSKDIIVHCKNEIIYNANLLLDGLREIYEKNK